MNLQQPPLEIACIHHVAIICSNYERSKKFYCEIIGLKIIRETYRAERQSFKLDLAVNASSQIELFSFPSPPARTSRPEACGLRHLAFGVQNIEAAVVRLKNLGIPTEDIRFDELTGRKFVFFEDPDNLPIELYELP